MLSQFYDLSDDPEHGKDASDFPIFTMIRDCERYAEPELLASDGQLGDCDEPSD